MPRAAISPAPLAATDPGWQQIAAGVAQRATLLERVLADVYGPQTLLTQGLMPAGLVLGHPGYLRPLHGVHPPGGRHLHLVAFDLACGPQGHWHIVAQHTQVPAGLDRVADSALRALLQSLHATDAGAAPLPMALLTPGPFNHAYPEHAHLAHRLDLSLVEGRDLVVRDLRLFLRTLHGLVPVQGLLSQLEDSFLDPLELRADSTLGVPGLLQAMRAGHVRIANAPGSAFLEAPALLDCLPALCRHLLEEELCLSREPPAQGSDAVAQPPVQRVFALAHAAHSWNVLPADPPPADGGAASAATPLDLARHAHPVTRRAADNLYWLGRYTARTQNAVQLASLTLHTLIDTTPTSDSLRRWLGRMAIANTLVLPGVPPPGPPGTDWHPFVQALVASLGRSDLATSVGYTLRALRLAAAAARERLAPAHWDQVHRTETVFLDGCAAHPLATDACAAASAALATLTSTGVQLAAVRGLQTPPGNPDAGWHLLCLGHAIEHLGFSAGALSLGLQTGSVHTECGCRALLALGDASPAILREPHGTARQLEAMVYDGDRPGSLAATVHALRSHLDLLVRGAPPGPMDRLAHLLPDPAQWQREALHAPGAMAHWDALAPLLRDCSDAANHVATVLATTWLRHDAEDGLSLGA